MPDPLICPLNELLHVRRVGMTAVVLPPRELAIKQSLIHRRHPSPCDSRSVTPRPFAPTNRTLGSRPRSP